MERFKFSALGVLTEQRQNARAVIQELRHLLGNEIIHVAQCGVDATTRVRLAWALTALVRRSLVAAVSPSDQRPVAESAHGNVGELVHVSAPRARVASRQGLTNALPRLHIQYWGHVRQVEQSLPILPLRHHAVRRKDALEGVPMPGLAR